MANGAAASLDFPTWLAGSQLAPYITERKAGGALVTMFDSLHPPIEVLTTATANMVLVQNIGGVIRQKSDLGDGLRNRVDPAGAVLAFRPTYANQMAVHVPHHVRSFSWPLDWIAGVLSAGHDAAPAEVLASVFGRPLQSPSLHHWLNMLWAESDDGTAGALLTAEGISLCVLGELLRTAQAPVAVARGGLPPRSLRLCIDHVMANLDREVSIAELAAVAGLSCFHFARAFRASTGQAPGGFQRTARMRKAQQLLANSELPVIEIAAQVGYQAPQAFARVFRRSTGVTPLRWRHQHRL